MENLKSKRVLLVDDHRGSVFTFAVYITYQHEFEVYDRVEAEFPTANIIKVEEGITQCP